MMCNWDDKIVNDEKKLTWIMESTGFLNIWIDLTFLVTFIDGISMVCKATKYLSNAS